MELLSTRSRYLGVHTAINTGGKCVIYIMSRDQRVVGNHALHQAQQIAMQHALPLVVVFCLREKVVGNRAQEHIAWLIDGLKDVERSLAKLSIPFMLTFGDHLPIMKGLIHHLRPAVLVADFSPLAYPLRWQNELAKELPVLQVDTHNIIPAWRVSNKQEYSARTIRPKIHALLNEYLFDDPLLQQHPVTWPGRVVPMKELQSRINNIISKYQKNETVLTYASGEQAGRQALNNFIKDRLRGYASSRNDPAIDGLSNLSPYLHYGHISSQNVINKVRKAAELDESLHVDVDALIEEMIVRKELSDNYCFYNSAYASLDGAPAWALRTLENHSGDTREWLYEYADFAAAKTHDAAWNAAQRQLLTTGKMHGYMRMYWAKKVLEWSSSPQVAYNTLVKLNDFYSIDGGDPNGYVGILWSIAGLHDRPWGERSVYGTVRCMVYDGLKRKFNIQAYIDKW